MMKNRFGNLSAPEGNTHQKPWNDRPKETMLQKYYKFPTWQQNGTTQNARRASQLEHKC